MIQEIIKKFGFPYGNQMIEPQKNFFSYDEMIIYFLDYFQENEENIMILQSVLNKLKKTQYSSPYSRLTKTKKGQWNNLHSLRKVLFWSWKKLGNNETTGWSSSDSEHDFETELKDYRFFDKKALLNNFK